jgi:hypothetical protein
MTNFDITMLLKIAPMGNEGNFSGEGVNGVQ